MEYKALVRETAADLTRVSSWLPSKRRDELRVFLDSIRSDFEAYKQKFDQKLEPVTDADMLKPAWLTVRPDENGGYVVVWGPKTASCRFHCSFCGLKAGSAQERRATPQEFVAQAGYALQQAREILGADARLTGVELLGESSFYDERSFTKESREALCEAVAAWPGVRKVMVETRPEFIKDAAMILETIEALGPDVKLIVGSGVESVDPFISEQIAGKRFGRGMINRALGLLAECRNQHGKNVEFHGYLIVGLAPLTEHEAIQDAVNTAQFLFEASRTHSMPVTTSFEPCVISERTLQGFLHDRGQYASISNWAILEILARIKPFITSELQIPRVGGRDDMDFMQAVSGLRRENGLFDTLDPVVYYALQQLKYKPSIDDCFSMIMAGAGKGRGCLREQIKAWAAKTLNGETPQALVAFAEAWAEPSLVPFEEERVLLAMGELTQKIAESGTSPVSGMWAAIEGLAAGDNDAVSRFVAQSFQDRNIHVRVDVVSVQRLESGITQISTLLATETQRAVPFWLTLPPIAQASHRMLPLLANTRG